MAWDRQDLGILSAAELATGGHVTSTFRQLREEMQERSSLPRPWVQRTTAMISWTALPTEDTSPGHKVACSQGGEAA